ncbi:MAG: hypothetical protein FJW34_19775, partial [Acidobacteria bacterium]|nr:hypothetical protein [Acidobacteriota bacterium]
MFAALRSRLAWPALLFLLCAGFYWRLVFTNQYSYLETPDVANMELPRFQFQASEWRHTRFPLWDPHQWCGQPFLGGFSGAAYPLNWLLSYVPFERGKISHGVMHWYFVFLHFQGALFAWWLCRDLQRSQAASLAAGLVFALGGFMGSTDWPNVLNGAVWAPAVLLFLLRAARGERPASSAALSGVCLGLAWLSGHHEAPFYLTLAAAGVWIYHLASKRGSRLRLAGLAALALVFTVLVSGLQTVPGYEFGQRSWRWAGTPEPLKWNERVPYTVHAEFSFTPASLLGTVLPGHYRHVNPFVGFTALTLALFAVAATWRKHPAVRLFGVLTLAAVACAMAASNVFHGMLYALVPMMDKARVPARFLLIFNLGIAPLVAYGLDALREEPASRWLRRAVWLLAPVALGIFAIAGGLALAGRFDAGAPSLAVALSAALLAALLAAWRAQAIGGRALAASLVLLSFFELGMVSGANQPNLTDASRPSLLAQLRAHDDIASFLRIQPGPVRVAVNDQDVPYNFGQWQLIDTLWGYNAGITGNILELETHKPRTQDLLAVNYTVSREPTRPGQELVFSGASGVRVYRNPSALPRARIVHEIVQVPEYSRLRQLIDNLSFDPRRQAAMLTPPPPLEQCAGAEQVRILERRPSRVVLEVRAECRGLVVLADTAFPGWRASLDGRRVPIREAYGAVRGVVVE